MADTLFTALATGDQKLDQIQRQIAAAFAEVSSTLRRGRLEATVTSKSGALRITDETIVEYTGRGGDTITLPRSNALGTLRGRLIAIMHSGAGSLTVACQGSDTINGSKTVKLYAGACMLAMADGNAKWQGASRDEARDWSSYRHAGGSSLEAWYWAGCTNATTLTTGAPSLNVLRAIPFIAPARGGTVDRIAINVTGPVAGNQRIGIYTNKADDNLYPDALQVDSGDLSTAGGGVKSFTTSIALQAGRLYWLALAGSSASTMRCLNLANCSHILGTDNTLSTTPAVGLSVAFTYGALPPTFSAGAAIITAAPIPAIAFRMTT